MVCVDENGESLDLARAKASAVKDRAEFLHSKLDDLELEANQFDCVIGDASLVSVNDFFQQR